MAAITTPARLPVPPPITIDGVEFTYCPCVGVPPGRACTACNSTKWTKRCVECNGSGKIFVSPRSGSNATLRAQVHGTCMGRGQIPCQMADVKAIQALTDEQSRIALTASKKKAS